MDLQVESPLKQVESLFEECQIDFRRSKKDTLSVCVNSNTELPQPLVYKMEFTPAEQGCLFATVHFGLPLNRSSLRKLADFLDDLIANVNFDQVGRQQLEVGYIMDSYMMYEGISTLTFACDTLYPLICHIRKEREWSEELVKFAFMPNQCFFRG